MQNHGNGTAVVTPAQRVAMERFLTLCSVDTVQKTGAEDLASCIDNAPSLHAVVGAVGRPRLLDWLTGHLKAVAEFVGARRTLDERQMAVLAEILYNEYGWLNVRELVAFFYRLKLGKYVEMYGSFDPSVVMRSMQQFLVERVTAVRRKESAEQRAAQRVDRSRCVSYDEYRRMLAAGELDHLIPPDRREFFRELAQSHRTPYDAAAVCRRVNGGN